MLVLIKNKKFDGDLNPDRAVTLAIYHDVPEIITDDLPTPVKYANPEIRAIYNQVETQATGELISLLPEEFKEDFSKILNYQPTQITQNNNNNSNQKPANQNIQQTTQQNTPEENQDTELRKIVKHADTISAYIKCLREKSLGNPDFNKAHDKLKNKLLQIETPEVKYFIETFLPAFEIEIPEITHELGENYEHTETINKN